MQQIYQRTPVAECDFNKVAKTLYWNHTSAWVFSCRFLYIFRTSFLRTSLGGCFNAWYTWYCFRKCFIFSIWDRQTFACSKSIIRRKFEICSQLTIKTLERCHWHRSSVFILNLEQFSHLILFFKQVIPCTDGCHHKQKASQKNIFFHLTITETCVVMCLAEDGSRMGGI